MTHPPTFARLVLIANKKLHYDCSAGGTVMCVYSIRLTDNEKIALEAYSKANGITMSEALKGAFFDMLEDEYDIKAADKALAKYRENPKIIPSDEIYKKYGV